MKLPTNSEYFVTMVQGIRSCGTFIIYVPNKLLNIFSLLADNRTDLQREKTSKSSLSNLHAGISLYFTRLLPAIKQGVAGDFCNEVRQSISPAY